MKRSLFTCLPVALIALLGPSFSSGAEPAGKSVLTYHADPGRSGNFIVPSLTWERASSLQLDGNFHARVSGHVYAQPLLFTPSNYRRSCHSKRRDIAARQRRPRHRLAERALPSLFPAHRVGSIYAFRF
jgi:hypothetical protein